MRSVTSNAKTEKKSKILIALTPLIVLILCAGIIAGLGYYPIKKLSTLANVVFSANAEHAQTNDKKYSQKEFEAELEDGSKIIYPSFGKQYAVLKIESIGLEAPVYWGTSSDLFKLGVCQYTGSVFIGEEGNVVLDAKSSIFKKINEIKAGDLVVLTSSYGEFTYKMKESKVFGETTTGYMPLTSEDRLVLNTSYENVLGATGKRFAVICELVEKNFYE